jgi:hypothetical protein
VHRTELAGLLQRTEGVEVGSYIDASPQIAKGAGTATKRIGGVTCLAARNIEEPFLNRALGVGTIAPATPKLLERIERHYASIGKPSRIAVATGCVPLASLRALERRGYAPAKGEGELIYVYDRRTPPAMPAVPGLAIERAGPELAAVYSKTGFESFNDRGPQFVPSSRRWCARAAADCARTSGGWRASRPPPECSSTCDPSAASGTAASARRSAAEGCRRR